MSQSAKKTKLENPRMVEGKPLLVAGLSQRSSDNKGMPAQWQRFVPYLGNIPGQVGRKAYGVLYNGDDSGNIDYMCGVEVKDFSDLPAGFSSCASRRNITRCFRTASISRPFTAPGWGFSTSGYQPPATSLPMGRSLNSTAKISTA